MTPRSLWFWLMAIAGFAFGLNAERRPFGDDVLLHPLAIFVVLVVAALLALRIVLRRPVPEFLPERALIAGCLIGLAAFLIGNWIDTHLLTAGRPGI